MHASDADFYDTLHTGYQWWSDSDNQQKESSLCRAKTIQSIWKPPFYRLSRTTPSWIYQEGKFRGKSRISSAIKPTHLPLISYMQLHGKRAAHPKVLSVLSYPRKKASQKDWSLQNMDARKNLCPWLARSLWIQSESCISHRSGLWIFIREY